MNDAFRREVSLISQVSDKLINGKNQIDAVHDEVAFNLYKKCNAAFDSYKSSNDIESFQELRNDTDNIVGFREFIQEYYPDKVYNNTNVKENNKIKDLTNGHSIMEKENVA